MILTDGKILEIAKERFVTSDRRTYHQHEKDADVLRAARAIISAHEASKWQPIITYKHDNFNDIFESVLVSGTAVSPYSGNYVCEAYSTDDGFSTHQGLLKNQPTSFQPLPAPPVTNGEKI